MRALLCVVVLSASLSLAGDKPTGAGCEKSLECLSGKCGNHRCRPDSRHPGGKGALCESDSHCLSHACNGTICGDARKDISHGSTSKGSTRSTTATAEPEAAPEEAKVFEVPLPARTACTDGLTSAFSNSNPDAALREAASICATSSPAVIEQAKTLALAGYGRTLSITARTVREATPEQLACTKKEQDKDHQAKRQPEFQVPSICLQPADVQACAEDLAATVYKDEKRINGQIPKAQAICREFPSQVITDAKVLFFAGYDKSFSSLVEIVKKESPATIDCMKRDYELETEGRTRYSGFSVSRICKRPQAEIDCYFELLSSHYEASKFNGRARDEVEGQCRSTTPEQRALISDLKRAGFTQRYTELSQATGKLTPAQYSCVRANMARESADAKTAGHYYPPKKCAP